jgi:hypothetical protein
MYELPGSDSTGIVIITEEVSKTGSIPEIQPHRKPLQDKSA